MSVTKALNRTIRETAHIRTPRWSLDPCPAGYLRRLRTAARDKNLECRRNNHTGEWEVITIVPELLDAVKNGMFIAEKAWTVVLSGTLGEGKPMPLDNRYINHMREWRNPSLSDKELNDKTLNEFRQQQARDKRQKKTDAEGWADNFTHDFMVAAGKDEHHHADAAAFAKAGGTRHKYIRGADFDG